MRNCSSASQFLFISFLWVAFCPTPAQAQSPAASNPCSPDSPKSRPVLRISEGPKNLRKNLEIRVRDVRFEGAITLPVTDQNDIASKLMDETEENTRWLQDMEEKVQVVWQHHGFFKVKVAAGSRELSSDSGVKDVALSFQIDEGKQYRLGEMRFRNATQFTDEQLRQLFPISQGEIFDTEKIGKGMEAVRKAYGDIGFINFVAVPETAVDEQNSLVSVDFDFDEGKQFHIAKVEILGLDQELAQRLVLEYKLEPGEVFDFRKLDELKADPHFHEEDDVQRWLDEKTSTVCIVVDARGPRQLVPDESHGRQ